MIRSDSAGGVSSWVQAAVLIAGIAAIAWIESRPIVPIPENPGILELLR